MKYIIIDDGDIYKVPNKMAKIIKEASDEAAEKDEDATPMINTVRTCGKFVGTVLTNIRN